MASPHRKRGARLQNMEEELRQRIYKLHIWKAQRIQEIETQYVKESAQVDVVMPEPIKTDDGVVVV